MVNSSSTASSAESTLSGPIKDSIEHISTLYKIECEIGEGASGSVYSGSRLSDGVPVAIKLLKRECVPDYRLALDEDNEHKPILLPMEVYILRRLKHPNLIKLLDYYETAHHYVIITDTFKSKWSTNGNIDLFEYMAVHGLPTEKDTLHILKQLLSALLYLKSMNVYHLDLKDENIIIDDQMNIKVIDFGAACILLPDRKNITHFGGTLVYAAPEIGQQSSYCAELSDVWTFGITAYLMIYGRMPFKTRDDVTSGATVRCPTTKKVSKPVLSLIQACLINDPRNRTSMEGLRKLML
jgi:serine/threonine protein kinase